MTYPKKPERKPGETDSDFTARMEAWTVRLEAAKERNRKHRAENAERYREYQCKYYAENIEQIRKHRAENAERYREYQCKYYAENIEQIRKRNRKYYAENIEQIRERNRKYYAENIEQIREYKCKYYVENAARYCEYGRKYYAENSERIRERCRKYRAENSERIRERERERCAKKFGLSRAEYLKAIRHACGIKASLGEAAVCGYLESAGIRFEREKSFDWLRNSETGCRFRCDFYLPDLGTVIEYNGPQHYGYRLRGFTPDDLARRMVMDLEKVEKIAAHGLRLIAIPGDEIRTAGQIRQYLARELASDGRADSK